MMIDSDRKKNAATTLYVESTMQQHQALSMMNKQ
jgi:hypothetical protein